MLKKPAPNYLRRERRATCLTQEELAYLVCCRCPIQFSRIERGLRVPSLRIVLASEILFGKPTRAVFPYLYDAAEECVVGRAYRLFQRLEKNQSRRARRKKEFLQAVLGRAVTLNKQNQIHAENLS